MTAVVGNGPKYQLLCEMAAQGGGGLKINYTQALALLAMTPFASASPRL
jgi:hypothetical protein